MGTDMHMITDERASVRRTWLACVYETVDAVAETEGNVPPGTAVRLHRAIDALKAVAPEDDYIARAEAMSVTVHRLEWALLGSQDDTTARALRQQLMVLGREWIEAIPLFH
jgi:hypothetical protein